MTPDSIFYIASTTKSLTAFAAALLHHSKTIDLDGSLATYFPGLTLKPPLSAADITVRDLLTHTHGISKRRPHHAAHRVYGRSQSGVVASTAFRI